MKTEEEKLLELLDKLETFCLTPEEFYPRSQEADTLPSHSRVIRPLLNYAKVMRIYLQYSDCDPDILDDINSLGTVQDNIAEIDLSKEVLSGHEKLWNAQLWRRGSIVLGVSIDDAALVDIFRHCRGPEVMTSMHQLKKSSPVSAFTYARKLSRQGLIGAVFPTATGIEYLELFPPKEDLHRFGGCPIVSFTTSETASYSSKTRRITHSTIPAGRPSPNIFTTASTAARKKL